MRHARESGRAGFGGLMGAVAAFAIVIACSSASAGQTSAEPPVAAGGLGAGGLAGGGTMPGVANDCVSPSDRARVAANIAAFHAAHPELGVPRAYALRTAPPSYEFYPIGGNWFRDDMLNNFVDLNGASGSILDWACTDYTYDGHQGHDNLLRSFAEKRIGVPIFAALAGTVVDRHDGEPDENTVANNVPANYVVLWNGGGLYTYYWHMKTGSVAVSVGQAVSPGQQLGLVASSGYSNWPHLHFETNLDGVTFEPYAGACRPGVSGWQDQYPIDRSFKIADFAFSNVNMASYSPPAAFPRTGQLAFAERPHWFWLYAYGLPANSTWRVRYFRPGGALEFDSGTGSFGGNPFCRWSWWYWNYNITAMGSVAGTWRMKLDINGATVVDAAVEVKPTRDPLFNRPPAALNGLSFEPAMPRPGHALFCRVDTLLINDDPDFDVVRYTYVWTVDGVEKRRITSAGQADALAGDLVTLGSVIRCDVTPGDGTAVGPIASIQAGGCVGDFDGSGGTPDATDIGAFFAAWLAGSPTADVDLSGGTPDASDIDVFFSHWLAGC